MLARLSAFVIWALVAATAVFWGLRLWVRAPAVPVYAVAVGDATAVRSDLSRLLGVTAVNAPAAAIMPEAASRFRLMGIVAPKYPDDSVAPGHGVALIAVDGKMPKAFAVGSRIDGDLMLRSVSLRTVSIAPEQGTQAITLELPPLTPPATGTLSAGGIGGAPLTGEPQAGQAVPQAAIPQFPPARQTQMPGPNTSQPVPQLPVPRQNLPAPNARAQ